MKNLHKLEFFGLFDTHPIKKPSGVRLQLLLNGFRVLIHEKVERSRKVALENTKCKKNRFVDYFVVLVAVFFTKLHLSPQTTLLDNEIIHC